MPVENAGEDIQEEPLGRTNGVPAVPTQPNADTNEACTAKFEKDIKKGEVWLIRIGVAALLINTIIALIYYGQLKQMRQATTEATKASVWSAYWACLSSQSAQNVFAQSQSGANDSHAMAVATIQQAAAEIQSERSNLLFLTQPANPGENLGRTFGLVTQVENVGKGDASDVKIQYWGVLLKPSENLRLNTPVSQRMTLGIGRFPAGYTFPEKAKPPHGQLFQIAPLRDVKGELIPITSPDATDLMNGGTTVAYIYGNMAYSDIAGHHSERFCHSIWQINANTERDWKMTDNENRCNAYNRADPQYTYRPLEQTQLSTNTVASQIACQKPKE